MGDRSERWGAGEWDDAEQESAATSDRLLAAAPRMFALIKAMNKAGGHGISEHYEMRGIISEVEDHDD